MPAYAHGTALDLQKLGKPFSRSSAKVKIEYMLPGSWIACRI